MSIKTLPSFILFLSSDLDNTNITFTAGLLWVSTYCCLFFYFFWQASLDYKESTYLSTLDENDMYIICEKGSLYISGTFQADVNGYWDTDARFQPNSSIYEVTFKESPALRSAYQATIEKFEEKIKALGENARLRDMSYTALTWITFSDYDYDTDMGIRLTGDVDTLFGDWHGLSGSFHAYQRSEELAPNATQSIMECYTRNPANDLRPNVDDKLNYVSLEFSAENLMKFKWIL